VKVSSVDKRLQVVVDRICAFYRYTELAFVFV